MSLFWIFMINKYQSSSFYFFVYSACNQKENSEDSNISLHIQKIRQIEFVFQHLGRRGHSNFSTLDDVHLLSAWHKSFYDSPVAAT